MIGIGTRQLSCIKNRSGRATYQTLYEIQITLDESSDPETIPVTEILE